MNILLIGNCHVNQIKPIMEVMLDNVCITAYQYRGNDALSKEILDILEYETVVVMSTFHRDVSAFLHENGVDVDIQIFPHLNAFHFHPDVTTVHYKNGGRVDLLGSPNHSLLCIYGWLNKIDDKSLLQYFNGYNFEALGLYFYRNKTEQWMLEQERATGYSILKHQSKWDCRGVWMYAPNHPKAYIYSDVILEFASKNSIEVLWGAEPDFVFDRGSSGLIWPVYDFLASGVDLPHGTVNAFKLPDRFSGKPGTVLSVLEFIKATYELYSLNKDCLDFSAALSILKNKELKTSTEIYSAVNPYLMLNDSNFWKRSISKIAAKDVDPVVKPKFSISVSDKVATAGSCFAQHVSQRLTGAGFSWENFEKPPATLTSEEAVVNGYGVYSARFGNIYTSSQLVQLFQRAFSLKSFDDSPWLDNAGKIIDPYRPYIQPSGFSSLDEYYSDLDIHLAAVREMFKNLSVFVFTLGLTECWVRVADSAVLPFHPGVLKACVNSEDFVFKNMNVDEVVSDLILFKSLLVEINPDAKILVTVSPVPLIATYGQGHVLTQTTYSKSVLRVAAEIFTQKFDNAAYFPSYEIVSSHYNRGAYYAEDLREVNSTGVDHVMHLLLKHYTYNNNLSSSEYEEARVVCDEENLDL